MNTSTIRRKLNTKMQSVTSNSGKSFYHGILNITCYVPPKTHWTKQILKGYILKLQCFFKYVADKNAIYYIKIAL
jgi:hypothetical protein